MSFGKGEAGSAPKPLPDTGVVHAGLTQRYITQKVFYFYCRPWRRDWCWETAGLGGRGRNRACAGSPPTGLGAPPTGAPTPCPRTPVQVMCPGHCVTTWDSAGFCQLISQQYYASARNRAGPGISCVKSRLHGVGGGASQSG